MKMLLKFILWCSLIHSIFSINCDFYIDEEGQEGFENLTEIVKKNLTLPQNVKILDSKTEFPHCDQKNTQNIPFHSVSHNIANENYQEYYECSRSERTIVAKRMKNTLNKIRKIATGEINFAIFTVKCKEENMPCYGTNLNCRCVQIYKTVSLDVNDDESNTIQKDQFYYPSECLCKEPDEIEKPKVSNINDFN